MLPTGYKQRSCWPVIYLLHGTAVPGQTQPVSLQWLQIGNGQLLKMNIPAILVVPGGSGYSWWINDWWNGYRHPAWGSWVLQDLVPLVAHRLNVCPSRQDHVIAGLSMGGYGAMYLASQRPDYFGTAGSFSGVLSPESPNFISIYPQFPTLWGPPDKFYAIGHDPLALVGNLQHTRLFVGVGNGIPTAGETDNSTAQFEEGEFDQESLAFAAKARAADDSIHFDQHAGTHTDATWLQSLTDMLAWNPFKPVVSKPKSWTFTTVETNGAAWGYHFAFSHYSPPTQIIQFAFSHGVFSARGGGRVTITPPTGKAVTGRIPFDIRNGKLVELNSARKPHVVGGYEKLQKISLSIHPAATATAPVTISFRTQETLPAGQEYQIGLEALSTTGGTCADTVGTRIVAPPPGKLISVALSPPATATTPGNWCSGTNYAGVTIVQKGAPPNLLGTLLGYQAVTLP